MTKMSAVPKQVAKFLGEVDLFDTLQTDELSIIASHMNVFEIERGGTLFREGDKGEYFCFVLDGCLDVNKKTETGEDVKIVTLSKGASIGEMSILDPVFRSATITAREKSTVVSLSQTDFESILENFPKVGVKVLKGLSRYLSQNLRRTTKLLADLTDNYRCLMNDYRQLLI